MFYCALLQHRAYVTAVPSAKVKRRLWFWGILLPRRLARSDEHVALTTWPNHEDQDSRPAQPEPRRSGLPPQLTSRNAHTCENSLSYRLRIATFNTRTLRDNWRVQELIRLASDLKLSVLGLQEHRRSDGNGNRPPPSSGWELKLSPASPLGTGGIGFLLSPTASKALLNVTFPSDRVGLASFALKGRRRLHVICAYAPTAPRTIQDPSGTETFYDSLGTLLDSIPGRDQTFVVGDFNAPLPADGFFVKNSCGLPNPNSSHLSCFIQARNLLAVNGFLRQRVSKLPTFYGPNNRITRLDWILCPASTKSRLRKVMNIRPRCIESDHSLILCEANLRWPHFNCPRAQPLWSALSSPETQRSFLRRMLSETPDLGESVDAFTRAVQVAAASLPERKANQPKALWDCDPVIAQARRLVQSAAARSGQDSEEARGARCHLQRTYAERAEAYVAEAVREIQLATDNCRHNAAWRAIDRLTGRKSRPNTVVAANSIKQRKARLAAHYRQVLNAPAPTAPLLPIHGLDAAPPDIFSTAPITVAETRRALKTTRANSAPGVDGVPPQVLKISDLATPITGLLNSHSCIGGDDAARAPPQWRLSKIVSIPKKGNSTSLDNQRGIALECTLAKLLNTVLRNRLQPALDPLLLDFQSGFRAGRSTIEQVAAIRCVIDDCRTRQKGVSIVFIDFRKAFDSVSRPAIAWLLNTYGVPPLLVTAILDLYDGSSAFVQTSHGPSEEFSTTSGVLQGDTLAPLLFLLVVDYVLRRCLDEADSFVLAPRRCSRLPTTLLPALAYADDIALLCRDPSAAQRALTRLCEEGNRVGLQVNARKTEVLHIGFTNAPTLVLPSGKAISECQDFRYLGSKLMSPDSIVADRKAQAWRATHLLRPIFNSPARDELKIKLFRATVESVLLYGMEAVPLTETRERALDAMHRSLLRGALGVHFPEKLTTRALMERTGLPPLSTTLRARRQRLLGHCLRSHGRGRRIPLALTLLHQPSERYRRGQGRTLTLRATLHQNLHALGMSPASTVVCPSLLFSQRVRARQ